MGVIENLRRHEGFRSKPYKDTQGFLSIGYGINLDAGITEEEAALLLIHRVKNIQDRLMLLPYWNNLTPARKEVLVNMTYNLGFDGLMKFRKTLRYIKDGEYSNAADEMLNSKWATQVGYRARELANMMRVG